MEAYSILGVGGIPSRPFKSKKQFYFLGPCSIARVNLYLSPVSISCSKVLFLFDSQLFYLSRFNCIHITSHSASTSLIAMLYIILIYSL